MKRAVAVALGIAVVIAVIVAPRLFSDSRVEQAIAVMEDDDRFENTTDAGAAFVRVSSLLVEEGEACEDRRGRNDRRCSDMFAAAAYARVTAVSLLECSRAGITDARREARAYLRGLRDARSPEMPSAPDCS